jgi:aminoglycoside phosphotransferase (APT) family kinase protein
METTLEDRLLNCLRQRLGAAIAFAESPTPLSGGFDTTILSFRLAGVWDEWAEPLVLRVMTRRDLGARVRREAAVHAALVKAGYPAPRVLLAEADPAPLGLPFLVMQRLPGGTMWSAVAKAKGFGPILAMPRRLAELHARLHRVSGEFLRESARAFGMDLTTIGVDADLQRLSERIEREGLDGLVPGARWLVENRPAPAQAEVICHGDFHPLNIMVAGDRISGVIDWANAALAEPAYDISGLRVIALWADPGVPAWARGAANVARRLMVRRYMSIYRATAPLDSRNLAYYEAIRLLSALVFAGEPRIQEGNPWSAPHTVSRLIRQFERVSGLQVRI